MRYRGGNVSDLVSGDYSELYGLLRALCASVGSRLFRIYHIPKNINPKNKASCPANEIHTAKVISTFFEGKQVYPKVK